MKTIAKVIGLAAVHFALTITVFAIGFSRGMDRFDSFDDAAPSAFDSVLVSILSVPWLPYAQISMALGLRGGMIGLIAFSANSLFWGYATYLMICGCSRILHFPRKLISHQT